MKHNVPVPNLDDEVVLVPGYGIRIRSGHADNYIVNNEARAPVDRLTVKFVGEIVQDTNGYDLFKLYENFSSTENERASMLREVI